MAKVRKGLSLWRQCKGDRYQSDVTFPVPDVKRINSQFNASIDKNAYLTSRG